MMVPSYDTVIDDRTIQCQKNNNDYRQNSGSRTGNAQYVDPKYEIEIHWVLRNEYCRLNKQVVQCIQA
jgi:hypothetical protein